MGESIKGAIDVIGRRAKREKANAAKIEEG